MPEALPDGAVDDEVDRRVDDEEEVVERDEHRICDEDGKLGVGHLDQVTADEIEVVDR